MIYLFYGSDTDKVREKAFEWVEKARAKEPNLLYKRLAREDLSLGTLTEAAEAGGLFVRRLLILLDDPFPASRKSEDEEGEAAPSILEDHLDALAESKNAIVVLAPKLLAARAKKLAAKAEKSYVFDIAARVAARGFNGGLVNALAYRDGEKLWLELVRARKLGDAPEQHHGLLHWKARDLMEKGSRTWNPSEARALSLELIALLQESRRKGLDLNESLERFALSI